jgi:hypothetical protein
MDGQGKGSGLEFGAIELMADVGIGPQIEPPGDPSEGHCRFCAHRRCDFPFERIASPPFPQFLFAQTGAAQFANEDRFRPLLGRLSHERGGLIVLSLTQPDICVALMQQSQQAFAKRLASETPPSS